MTHVVMSFCCLAQEQQRGRAGAQSRVNVFRISMLSFSILGDVCVCLIRQTFAENAPFSGTMCARGDRADSQSHRRRRRIERRRIVDWFVSFSWLSR
jgi:hypothetical protein